MKTIRIGDVQNALVRVILWQVGREPITDRDLEKAKHYFHNRCAYCGEVKNLIFDHAIPINKTSLGQRRVGNLVPSCSNCNQRKGQRDFRDYLRDDPKGIDKISKISEYMEQQNYVPLSDDKQVRALLDAARKQVVDTAEEYIATIRKLLTDSPAAQPSPLSESPAIPALSAVASNRPDRVNQSTLASPDWAKILEIKRAGNRSWINLRRGCLDQMGAGVYHGTPKVRAASRAFAKRLMRRRDYNLLTLSPCWISGLSV
jgi:hypothetical protein